MGPNSNPPSAAHLGPIFLKKRDSSAYFGQNGWEGLCICLNNRKTLGGRLL